MIDGNENQRLRAKQNELASLIDRHCAEDGVCSTALTPLSLIRAKHPTQPLHALHEPSLCIVAQGRKQVMLAGEPFYYGQDYCLVVSVDLPVVGHVIEATPAAPYLCMGLKLDLDQLGALLMDVEPGPAGDSAYRKMTASRAGTGLSISPVSVPLLDAAIRLMQLLDSPQDIAVLAPLITREILYRLLSGEHNAELRHIVVRNNQLQPVNRAINWLKRNYNQPLHIEALAREAHMSSSTLHHQFKTLTAMSPLQYQKQLRLQEARRLMLAHSMDAATASYEVGYESPSQFSREYSRLFGAPPLRDINRLRSSTFPMGG